MYLLLYKCIIRLQTGIGSTFRTKVSEDCVTLGMFFRNGMKVSEDCMFVGYY